MLLYFLQYSVQNALHYLQCKRKEFVLLNLRLICLIVYPGEVLTRICGHKQHTCVYCEKRVWNVSRHMIRNHSKEALVEEALQHPLNSGKRRNAWKRIARLGDFDANIKLMKNYKEPLFIVRKREAKPDKEEELPCVKGFLRVA